MFANNRLVVDDKLNEQGARDKYFQFFGFEDLPGDDFFSKYTGALFSEKRFQVQVADGLLRLTLQGHECSAEPCFGLALSSLVIARHEKSAQLENYLSKVRSERKREFEATFHNVSVRPSAPSSALPVLFTPHYMLPIDPANPPAPGEDARIQISLARGETEPVTAAFFSPVSEFVSFSIAFDTEDSSRAPPFQIEDGVLSFRHSRIAGDGSTFRVAERYVRNSNEAAVFAGHSVRYWAALTAPLTTPPGKYLGRLSVRRPNGEQMSVPLEVSVLPFALREPDLPIGPFRHTVQENYWYEGEITARARRLEDRSLEKMRGVGLTALSISPGFKVSFQGGQLQLDFSAFETVMERARAHGFRAVVGYDHMIEGFDLCRGDPMRTYGIEPALFYRQLSRLIQERAVAKKWLPTRLIVCDEPVAEQVPATSARLSTLNYEPDPIVPFSATYSDDDKSRPQRLLAALPYSFLNAFNGTTLAYIANRRKRYAFYNRASRETLGFYLFRLAKTTPIDLRIAWTWNQNSGNPYYSLDGREDDLNWCNSTPDGDLLCTVFLSRHVQEGIDDYRYARTFELAMPTIKDFALQKRAARLWDELLNFPPSQEPAAGEYNPDWRRAVELRQQIAGLLTDIHNQSQCEACKD